MLFRSFANKVSEAGAPAGELCAPDNKPPPITSANELCEMRRLLKLFVNEGKGLEALRLLDPALVAILNYVVGKPNVRADGGVLAGEPPHFEVAGVVSGLCAQSNVCRLENGLDLITALSQYAQTPAGLKTFDDLDALVGSAAFKGLLDTTNPDALKEQDVRCV